MAENDKIVRRKEKLAGYIYDLSKLVFAGLVVGGLTPLFSHANNSINWWLMGGGVVVTLVLASLANRLLK